MSENTQLAIVEEQALRISELSAALELITTNRNDLVTDLADMFNELEAAKTQLRAATATIDRLRTYIAQGVEL